MILEGIVTTLNEDASLNISPMGPMVAAEMRRLVMRPFTTSKTYINLKRTRQGVFHVTDDVEMLALAAVNQMPQLPDTVQAKRVAGRVLQGACRWYEFRVTGVDDSDQRASFHCEVIHQGRWRDFFGFNRAKHAVIEAAILATRTQFLPLDEILGQVATLEPIVEKTAGPSERRAFEFLKDYLTNLAKTHHCE